MMHQPLLKYPDFETKVSYESQSARGDSFYISVPV